MTVGHVRFTEVWKKFRYGEIHNRLRDFIPALFARTLRTRTEPDALSGGEFWALRDVSFELGSGDSLGIIGPNGAGKSTILKLLTRILRPTHGECETRGRVGALIDVGAGFHPDLTGRENVYLQGAIMGMPRAEIARKFDEIVAFSGIGTFIDTPVKRYSSGMHARLGFAIAAHLDPDVLLVDEVLSVGDAEFQRKAFARITELGSREIPVVVVSHQLDAIATLCTEALLLHKGTVIQRGSPRECIAAYLHGSALAPAHSLTSATAILIEQLRVDPADSVPSGDYARLAIDCTIPAGRGQTTEGVGVRVRSCETAEVAFETSTLQLGANPPEQGRFGLVFDVQLNVPPGVYVIETFVWNRLAGRELSTGPSAYVDVVGGPEFTGPVQMNPRVRLVGPDGTEATGP